VTSRGDVHYVVTEHGVARLHGKSLRERAQELIAVAHPDFRSELKDAARRRRLL
jgi:acyl-CoA hydrolase